MFAKEALSFLHQIKQAPHASWAPDHNAHPSRVPHASMMHTPTMMHRYACMRATSRCPHPLQLDTSRDGACFDDWADDSGGGKWVKQWGSAPAAGTLKVATCNKLLGWYPAFAGRYTSAWGKEYGACKERELHKPGDYYSQRMWPICRPAAMLAHDRAMGRGGAGQEATPPFVMRTLYGQGRAKVSPPCR